MAEEVTNEVSDEQVEGQETDTENQTDTNDGITFDNQSDLDSFVDKRVSKALETAHSKWEEEAKQREDKAKKMARMSEAERTKAEQEERESALTRRERELQRREYSMQAKSSLTEAGLPSDDELVSLVLDDDVEKTIGNIKYVQSIISELVNKKVDELSKQTTPKSSAGFADGKNMSVQELAKKNRVI